jgi:hypothetical protein
VNQDDGARAELGGVAGNSRLTRPLGPRRAEIDRFDQALEIAQHSLRESQGVVCRNSHRLILSTALAAFQT